MVQFLTFLAAAALVGMVCLLLVGWGGLLSRLQRLGLALFAAGMVLAAIPRFMGRPPGWGDLAMLAGLVLFFAVTYGPKILRHIDGLDGAIDGRARVGPIQIDAEAIRQAMAVDRRRRLRP